jgi:DNA-binding XRE family transcriptional regulator
MKANKIREYKFEDLLENNFKNKKFREEYENLDREFVLAEEVIKLRIEKNMTLKELANITGTSQPTIARLESGKYNTAGGANGYWSR